MSKKPKKELLEHLEKKGQEGSKEGKPKMNLDAEDKKETVEKAAHLEHPQVRSKHNKVMPELTNDLAYFLHHPQLAPEHKQFPGKTPKC